MTRWKCDFLAVAALGVLAVLQSGSQAKIIFSTSPASANKLLQEGFLIGNGRLGGMQFCNQLLSSWVLKLLQRFLSDNQRWRS